MNESQYLKMLMEDKATTFEVLLELQNEGKSMNYCETFEGNLENIVKKARSIILSLNQILPKGKFEIQIEDIFDEETFVYVNENSFYVNKNINSIVEIN